MATGKCISFVWSGSRLRRTAAWLLAALTLPAVASAAGSEIHVSVQRAGNDQVSARGIDLRLVGDAPMALRLKVTQLDIVALSWHGPLDWQCPLQRKLMDDGGAERWQCDGVLQVAGHSLALQAMLQGEQLQLDFQHEGASARLQLPLPTMLPLRARIRQVPLSWLADTVRESWPAGQLGTGSLEGDLVFDGGEVLRGSYALRGLGLDSDDGQVAAADVNASGTFAFTPEPMRLQTQSELHGGEVLLGPVYVALPGTAVQVSLDARRIGDDWEVESLRWRDSGVLELAASASLQPAAEDWLRKLRLDATQIDLARAVPRYADSWLATVGFDGLQLAGKMGASVALDRGELTGVTAKINESVNVVDAAGRFALRGVQGGADWHASEQRPPRQLRWQSAHLHRVPIDAAQLQLYSAAGRLNSEAPFSIGVLGGQVVLNNLSLGPVADHSQISTGVALSDIDLSELSRVLEWPPLVGRLGGAIANINIDGQLIDLQGGLMLDTFDGTINVTALRLERPFGVAPSLHADIDMRALDLAQLTHAFDFGQITGRMGGHVHGLRLLDWQPVAFDARLRSLGGGRISQHAVDNLSSLGGSGAGALQGSMLKLFETFGYSAIGIGCRLADNVCVMEGLEPANDGYTIVKGSGLPRLTVIGHQRQVDWPTLVERLKVASSGQAPVIQ